MKHTNATALSVLMGLLVLSGPSVAARKPLRPSTYPETTGKLDQTRPHRKARRGAWKRLLAWKDHSKPARKSVKKSRASRKTLPPDPEQVASPDTGASIASHGIEITPVSQPAPPAHSVHIATIELERKEATGLQTATPASVSTPLPRLEVLDDSQPAAPEGRPVLAPAGPAEPDAAPRSVPPAVSPVAGWRGGYHDVGAGEDVNYLSVRYGVTREAITRYNRVPETGAIPEGRKLFIPPATGSYALKPEPVPTRLVTAHAAFAAPRVRRLAARVEPSRTTSHVEGDDSADSDRSSWDKLKETVSGVFTGFRRLLDRPSKDSEEETPAKAVRLPMLETARQPLASSSAARFEWPISGQILSPFGQRHGVPHNGIDLAASRGTPIRAAAAGKVIYSSTMRGYGNVIILDHGNKYFTVYAHNQQNLVGKASEAHPIDVRAGQTIALAGDSGNAQGPHLHFEIRYENKAIDPLPYLPGGAAAMPQAARPTSADADSRV